MQTHRFLCPSPSVAVALAEYLTCEGYQACWLMSDGTPTVVALCTRNAALHAAHVVGA